MKTPLEISSAIRLGEAYFCLSCEVVTDCADNCPVCGNRNLWPLENWLGKVYVPERNVMAGDVSRVRKASHKAAENRSRKPYWQMLRFSSFKP